MATIPKNTRIDFRIDDQQKKYLMHVASLRRKKLSAFILESAMKEAEELMADKNNFQLNQSQWKAFSAALDAPAREIPRLKNLFKGPVIFNE
ncbi:MAG: DUF1778 domain-containing protein [Candidatus Omnitrophica bacterium]|nr:DUF1778 domain-containing protein [Candidatus Omnitrophota bacterium]